MRNKRYEIRNTKRGVRRPVSHFVFRISSPAETYKGNEFRPGLLHRQASERSYQSVQHFRAAQAVELEREGVRAPDIGLELDLVERGSQPLQPRHGVLAEVNARLVATH